MRERVQLSTLCLLIVGMGDLIVSLLWLHASGPFGEGNPLFSWLARHGSLAFVLGKLAFLAGPIAILEYARQFRPRSAELGTWIATFLYLLFLAVHMRSMYGR
jgi:hypothetical protein